MLLNIKSKRLPPFEGQPLLRSENLKIKDIILQ
jgi:hypothetical protein